jgi:hypothetical protein
MTQILEIQRLERVAADQRLANDHYARLQELQGAERKVEKDQLEKIKKQQHEERDAANQKLTEQHAVQIKDLQKLADAENAEKERLEFIQEQQAEKERLEFIQEQKKLNRK